MLLQEVLVQVFKLPPSDRLVLITDIFYISPRHTRSAEQARQAKS